MGSIPTLGATILQDGAFPLLRYAELSSASCVLIKIFQFLFNRPTVAGWSVFLLIQRVWYRIGMTWYPYLAGFFAGMFLANAVPHFVQGVSGNKFPTPFAKPPGRGLSSPTINVVWALFNVLIGYVLLRIGQVSSDNLVSLIIFFIGVVAISIMSSVNFQKKNKE